MPMAPTIMASSRAVLSRTTEQDNQKSPDSVGPPQTGPTNTQRKSTTPGAFCQASSQEEIDRQHAAAQYLIQQSAQCSDVGIQYEDPDWPDRKEIPLRYKQLPAAELSSTEIRNIPCWSSRGHVDVMALQEMIKLGYDRKYKSINPSPSKSAKKVSEKSPPTSSSTITTNATGNTMMNYWDPEVAAVYNVAIRRPSHDAWGIPKIVLLFCDDFLHDCYELPYYKVFEKAIQPILTCLAISKDRVVRLLFASLPAGTTIPEHHDTGEWVKYTHRIHVPVLVQNPGNILFTCGGRAIRCTPGHVFEINNQCRHAVSNCDAINRVHLILDYVDEEFVRRPTILLQPAEVLLQTRRSIDRLVDVGKRPTPSFMILGAQKAGTTFLFELIMQHPWLIKPVNNRRETHCLDWRWNDKLQTVSERKQWCQQFFHCTELQKHPSCQTGDSTPSYLLDSVRVIPHIRQVFDDNKLKFLVICRDPVQRVESHYAMVTSTIGTPAQLKTRGSEWRHKSVDQVILEDWHKMRECGLLPYYWVDNSTNIDTIHDLYMNARFDIDRFEAFTGSPEEDTAWQCYLEKHVLLHTGSYGLLARGLYELNLRPWLRAFPTTDFLILKLEALKNNHCDNNKTSNVAVLEETLRCVWRHLDVPEYTIPKNIGEVVNKNAREYESILSADARVFLQGFYEPHNQRLHQLLRTMQQNHIHNCQSILLQLHWSESWMYKS